MKGYSVQDLPIEGDTWLCTSLLIGHSAQGLKGILIRSTEVIIHSMSASIDEKANNAA